MRPGRVAPEQGEGELLDLAAPEGHAIGHGLRNESSIESMCDSALTVWPVLSHLLGVWPETSSACRSLGDIVDGCWWLGLMEQYRAAGQAVDWTQHQIVVACS